MPVQRFARESLPAMPWKNGGGVTREVACVPPGADYGGFDWRISIASVARGGAFSAFPGVDRVITLLEGAGMRLYTADGAIDHRLEHFQPWAFAGELAIESQLVQGPCEDFNVMTRRGRCRAEVRVLREAQGTVAASAGAILVSGACVRLQEGGERFTLEPGQGLWWCDQPRHWHVYNDTGATVLVASIHPLGDAIL